MGINLFRYIEDAKELGAYDAKVINTNTIKTAPWTIMKCKYGCSNYNSNLCCPPNTPTYKKMQEIVDCYDWAILVQCKSDLSSTAKIIVELEKKFFLSGYYKALGFGAGPCQLCEKCNMEKCKHPSEARPSMESCGIDVYETVKMNGFPIGVLKNREGEKNCYGLVLIE